MAKKSKQKLKSEENIEFNSESLNEEEEEDSKKDDVELTLKKGREIQKEEGLAPNPSTGVVYVGHLPWGFVDSTLKKYFSQFGNITRIICPKSSKTGRSVGYAYIEFEDEETAKIAAKTMNNYILFEKILKCNFVEDKKKYDRIFLKWKKKFEFKERYKVHCEKMSKKKTKEEIKTMIQGLLDREEQRREKMKELGIEYEYKGFKEIIEEYKKHHLNEIKENIKNRNKENKKERNYSKESKVKTIEKKKSQKKLQTDEEEIEIEENEEINQIKEEEEEENEEEEEEEEEKEKKILKRNVKKKLNNKKIETIRKQRKLEKIEEKKNKKNKNKFIKGKK